MMVSALNNAKFAFVELAKVYLGYTAVQFAFVELAKMYLGLNHIPGRPSGFNPSPGDETICLDMVVCFPESLITEYFSASGQSPKRRATIPEEDQNPRSLRTLAHAVVSEYYDRSHHLTAEEHGEFPVKIKKFVKDWKKKHT